MIRFYALGLHWSLYKLDAVSVQDSILSIIQLNSPEKPICKYLVTILSSSGSRSVFALLLTLVSLEFVWIMNEWLAATFEANVLSCQCDLDHEC